MYTKHKVINVAGHPGLQRFGTALQMHMLIADKHTGGIS